MEMMVVVTMVRGRRRKASSSFTAAALRERGSVICLSLTYFYGIDIDIFFISAF